MTDTWVIDGTVVKSHGFEITRDEATTYRDYVESHVDYDRKNYSLQEVKIILCDDDMVDVNYKLQGRKFERIRRITGYLTGDLTSWNDAKQAEESERVKHG